MKLVEIIPKPLKGAITIPPSKSICHRAIIAAALAKGHSIIKNVVLSEDIIATVEGVQALGAKVTCQQDMLIIHGGQPSNENNIKIDCRESGSTLRFLMPLSLLNNNAITFVGRGNLGNRPLSPYLKVFEEQAIFHSNTTLPMEVRGMLKPGTFKLDGNVSSQFVTGLMVALPLLSADSIISMSSALESRAYIDLTLEVLESFGISIENDDYKQFIIKGNQSYKPTQIAVEGDYSQAAFWLAAGALSGDITCLGLKHNSRQGDKAIAEILQNSGARLKRDNHSINTESSFLHAFEVDVSQYPDIAPILAVVAALSMGTSKITGAARLRIKESDRLRAIASELNKLGAEIYEDEDSLTITGVEALQGGEVDSWGDHRIAMALAVAAIKCKNSVVLHNSSVIDKSYPNFFDDYMMLGGNLHERNLG